MKNLEDYSGEFDPDIKYEDFSKEALIRLLKAATEMYLGMDTSWRTVAKKRFGKNVALDMSREVWYGVKRCGCYMESVLPRRAMSITGDDVASWMKHLQIDPGLACIADIRCEMVDENTGVLTVDHCNALDDMEKLGDPDIQKYNCHELEWKGLQQGVDYMNPKIKVKPLVLPQLGCKRDIACKWEFKL
jgi:hypothetical protein